MKFSFENISAQLDIEEKNIKQLKPTGFTKIVAVILETELSGIPNGSLHFQTQYVYLIINLLPWHYKYPIFIVCYFIWIILLLPFGNNLLKLRFLRKLPPVEKVLRLLRTFSLLGYIKDKR